jgi:formate dehydrogenase maturation protein FdhE
MVSRSEKALNTIWQHRADRARYLASQYPASGEALTFIAALNSLQNEIAASANGWDSLLACRQSVCELGARQGPLPLREAALSLDERSCRDALVSYWNMSDTRSPRSFFARALLQPIVASQKQEIVAGHLGVRSAQKSGSRCPECGDLPQVAALRAKGDGKAQFLACALCLQEWTLPRGRCAACGEHADANLSYYDSPSFPQFQLQVCEACHSYLLTIDTTKEPSAIPDIDELVALPLGLWAQQQGYVRIQPSLIGL